MFDGGPPFINSDNLNVEGFVNKDTGRQVVENHWQNKTTDAIIANFNQVTNSTTLNGAISLNDKVIEVTSATGISIGSYIILFDPASVRFTPFFVTGVAGTTITLDSPVDFAYPDGTFIDVTIVDLAVNGSVTPQVFGLRGVGTPPGVELTFHLTRIIFECLTSSPASLNLFGNLSALTNGLLLRHRNGRNKNIFNVKTNGELGNIMYDIMFFEAENPVQGTDGFVSRLTFGSPSKMGVVVELPIGEDLEIWVQDDLLLLDSLHIVAEGHIV